MANRANKALIVSGETSADGLLGYLLSCCSCYYSKRKLFVVIVICCSFVLLLFINYCGSDILIASTRSNTVYNSITYIYQQFQ